MITKIFVDGFKTFNNFEMEFSPLTVLAGPNASGKSNLFNALHLLASLAETDLKTSFSQQRGELIELFTQYKTGYVNEMTFEVEMLVDKKARDNWGGEAELKYTRLRYRLKIQRKTNEKGINNLAIVEEHLERIPQHEDNWVKIFIPSSCLEQWRPKVRFGKRSKAYIYTELSNENVAIKIPQDGKLGGKETPAKNVLQTVLSGVNSVDFPHVFAAKEEMRSWRFLQLNPELLRKSGSYSDDEAIAQNGKNLAATLHRLKTSNESALTDIARQLNNLLPNLIKVDVYDNKADKQYIIKVGSEDGNEFTSQVLSEGTLRLLVLCVLQYDDKQKGLLCFEEPENGIHPFRMQAMATLLKNLSVDFNDTNMLLRQVIVNTHSPVLVGEMFKLEGNLVTIWLSRLITRLKEVAGQKIKLKVTQVTPIFRKGTQLSLNFSDSERKITFSEIVEYLQKADVETIKEQLAL